VKAEGRRREQVEQVTSAFHSNGREETGVRQAGAAEAAVLSPLFVRFPLTFFPGVLFPLLLSRFEAS
jgi:hypothetical protein